MDVEKLFNGIAVIIDNEIATKISSERVNLDKQAFNAS